jgi:hypothetical protein
VILAPRLMGQMDYFAVPACTPEVLGAFPQGELPRRILRGTADGVPSIDTNPPPPIPSFSMGITSDGDCRLPPSAQRAECISIFQSSTPRVRSCRSAMRHPSERRTTESW